MKLTDYRNTKTADKMRQLMRRYTVDNLVGITPNDFERFITRLNDWGHDHDFGTFKVDGKMKDRHIFVLAAMIDEFGLDVNGKSVLDVGCWSGGFSLLLWGLGAKCIECDDKVNERRDLCSFLFDAFEIQRCCYGVDKLHKWIEYDTVVYSGVLYHCENPLSSLRGVYKSVASGGQLFIETAAIPSQRQILEYKGPTVTNDTWFVPSVPALNQMCADVGFAVEKAVYYDGGRAIVRCGK